MEVILSRELREKAGSDSYNRYEYQVGWSVLHMINHYKEKRDFMIFCEFHDDMSEVNASSDLKKMNFYQVKTKSKGNFTFNTLFNKPAKKTHSFMGYLFYNFYHFGEDCSECYFIGNKEFDEEIKSWQAIIQDEKNLVEKNPDLYNKIKARIESEFMSNTGELPKNFHMTFETFIQNTHITTSNMPLENHSNYLQAEFFKAIKFETIQMNTAHLIFNTVINEVREKTKTIITTPISFNELKEKKGLDSKVFKDIEASKDKISTVESSKEIKDFLETQGFPTLKIKSYLRALKDHYNLFIDISNSEYIHIIQVYKQDIYIKIEEKNDVLDDLDYILHLMNALIEVYLKKYSHPFITRVKLEVLFFETLLSE